MTHNKQTMDFAQSYQYLVSLPKYASCLVLFLLGIARAVKLVEVNHNRAYFAGLVGICLAIFLVSIAYGKKWMTSYLVKQQFSLEKLNKYETLANYVRKLALLSILIYWGLYFYQFYRY
ncbi:hypothetical protein [Moraxella equi]|uniref:Uncharacterized protein n=1 Tax=Moraxella equi TaxID=60442 RepID=A0A378QQ38_9GAMM|nr:hypothetical protein [Moraxella equi]OPH37420.1 hypothetical protein B5J93_08215 [Moraxella equi]STZ03016.1 Uncharacterised protein [Moraxella equi]